MAIEIEMVVEIIKPIMINFKAKAEVEIMTNLRLNVLDVISVAIMLLNVTLGWLPIDKEKVENSNFVEDKKEPKTLLMGP